MVKINSLFFLLLVLLSHSGYSQNVQISGQISGSGSVENIHVINKSQKKFAVTTNLGQFEIVASINDTLIFSSVQYKLESIVVSKEAIVSKKIEVALEANVNKLDEVVVGKVLTGNLLSDLKNSEAKPKINFYDVGIPGYLGKPKTQSERLLFEADGGSIVSSVGGGINGGGVGLNFTKILNKITGRTKMLKSRVKLENEETLLFGLKSRLGNEFFEEHLLEEEYRMDFFYFCLDDPAFVKRCGTSDLEALVFLKEKYKDYLENRKEKD